MFTVAGVPAKTGQHLVDLADSRDFTVCGQAVVLTSTRRTAHPVPDWLVGCRTCWSYAVAENDAMEEPS